MLAVLDLSYKAFAERLKLATVVNLTRLITLEKRRLVLALLILNAGLILSGETSHANNTTPQHLPYGLYPTAEVSSSIEQIQDPKAKTQHLSEELKTFSEAMGNTFEMVASKRNFDCSDEACLVQGFPLFYNRDGVGFFAGIRSKFKLLNEDDQDQLALDLKYVRSDTKEWEYYTQIEFERLISKPLIGLILRVGHLRATDTRFLGSGKSAKDILKQSFDSTRYRHREMQFRAALPVEMFQWSRSNLSVIPYFSTERVLTSPYIADNSMLFKKRPIGFEGGTLTRIGSAFVFDQRNVRYMTTRGALSELYYEFSQRPAGSFEYQRVGFNDRRYFSSGKNTLALRFTYDQLFREPPFWELDAIGGSDPIGSIAGSQIQKGFKKGRFHERLKLIENIEFRRSLRRREVFGQTLESFWVPVSLNAAALGPQ